MDYYYVLLLWCTFRIEVNNPSESLMWKTLDESESVIPQIDLIDFLFVNENDSNQKSNKIQWKILRFDIFQEKTTENWNYFQCNQRIIQVGRIDYLYSTNLSQNAWTYDLMDVTSHYSAHSQLVRMVMGMYVHNSKFHCMHYCWNSRWYES